MVIKLISVLLMELDLSKCICKFNCRLSTNLRFITGS